MYRFALNVLAYVVYLGDGQGYGPYWWATLTSAGTNLNNGPKVWMGPRADKDLIFSHAKIYRYIKHTRYIFMRNINRTQFWVSPLNLWRFFWYFPYFFQKKIFFDIFQIFHTNWFKPLRLFCKKVYKIFQKFLLSICQC